MSVFFIPNKNRILKILITSTKNKIEVPIHKPKKPPIFEKSVSAVIAGAINEIIIH